LIPEAQDELARTGGHISIKITLDLEFSTAYAGGFVPMHLGEANNSACQFHLRRSFALPPPPASVPPTQPRQFTNGRSGRNRLHVASPPRIRKYM
jgi:hypothetical protein